MACQLEDKRKTQAEICKVTGLTEVTLRKVYKELLENWDDLMPSNYTPAVPPERAFPTTVITSGRSSAAKVDLVEVPTSLEREKLTETKANKPNEVSETSHQARGKEDAESKGNNFRGVHSTALNQPAIIWQTQHPFGSSGLRTLSENFQNVTQMDIDEPSSKLEQKIDKETKSVAGSPTQTQPLSPQK